MKVALLFLFVATAVATSLHAQAENACQIGDRIIYTSMSCEEYRSLFGNKDQVKVTKRVLKDDPPQSESRESLDISADAVCRKEWTRRDSLNKTQYDYCIGQHTEAFQKIQKELDDYNHLPLYRDVSRPHCFKEWTKRDVINFRMVAHCLENEIEALKDLKFYKDKYGNSAIDVATKALDRYGNLTMTAYTVKRYFEE